jgi:hypothetical protein
LSKLKEITEYKNKILDSLTTNQNIVRALTYNNKDFLNEISDYDNSNQPNISDEDAKNLIYTQIFPYTKIDGLVDKVESFITLSFKGYKMVNNAYKCGFLYFYVFTNIKNMRTDYGLRTDYIISEIDEMMNKSRILGIGRLRFYDMSDFDITTNNEYLGGYIGYEVIDFN